jgi:hypothetical protein
LNIYDGRCTNDCEAEGRHYINPITYKVADVQRWNSDFEGGADRPLEEGDDNRRRNLEIPDPMDRNYWRPYDPVDGPFECMCDKLHGWVYDTPEDDGSCYDCSNIHDNCARCHYEMSPFFEDESENTYEGRWMCDLCKDNDLMATPNGDQCIPKIEDCTIDFYDQPQLLTVNRERNVWVCPECDREFFWDTYKEFDDQWRCVPCTIDDCLECPSAELCTDCDGDLIPSYTQDRCQDTIEFCDTAPINYDNDAEDFVCPDCFEGYYSVSTMCTECPIDNCVDCDEENHCLVCEIPLILNEDESACIDPLFRCDATRDNYLLEDGKFRCDNCAVGFTWEWNKENADTDYFKCQPCGDVIAHCTSCSEGVCLDCEDGWIPTFNKDKCMMPLENCNDVFEPYSAVDYGVFGILGKE